jgi:hypothetical protein
MDLTLNTKAAKAADSIASAITEAGKYVGVITRAEALKSGRGTLGLGLSFRTESGQSADYLDIYTQKSDGEALMGAKTVNALLVCLKLRGAKQGLIKCEKWDRDAGARVKVEVQGYPEMMGKRIGLLLQKELGTSDQGKDTERMTIFGVFSPETELTASEILDSKTNPERLPLMVQALMNRPVRDNRKKTSAAPRPAAGKPAATGTGFDDMDDDIPF